MRRWLACAAVLTFLSMSACTVAERKDAAQDWAAYVGATAHPDGSLNKDELGNPVLDGKPDYDPKEVAEKTAIEVAKRVGNPTDLAIWSAIGGLTVGIAWFKRKFLASAAKEGVKALGRTIVGKALDPVEPPDPEDKDES